MLSATPLIRLFFASFLADRIHLGCHAMGIPTPQSCVAEEDAELIARTGRGDQEAFAELVRRHERWARTLCGRMLGDFDEAEDMAQEAFLKVWLNAAKWRPRGTFRAWMATILTRQCLDYLRRARPTALTDGHDTPDLAPSVRESLESESEMRQLAQLLERLPTRQRMAVALFHGEGLSVLKAAEAMGLSPKAFESLLQRARERLKAMWRNSR